MPMLHSFTTSILCSKLVYLNNHSGIQLSRVVFPHFIQASDPAEACYSAEDRRSRGFRRQPIRFFPHGHSAKYFTHYAVRNSAKYKFPRRSRGSTATPNIQSIDS